MMCEQPQDLSQISDSIWDTFKMALGSAADFAIQGISQEECSENQKELAIEVEKAESWDLLPFRHARLAAKGSDEAALLHYTNLMFPTGGYYASFHDAARAFARDLCNCAEGWIENWAEVESTRVEPLGEAMGWAAVRGVNITTLEKYEGKESEPLGWYASLCSLEDLFKAGLQLEFAGTGAERSIVTNGAKRFTPKRCPQCGGKCGVDRTVGRTRYVSCKSRNCGWRGKETG